MKVMSSGDVASCGWREIEVGLLMGTKNIVVYDELTLLGDNGL
jgi:hypothetical protein